MKLIVGLGNPGAKYQMTRHNIGFMTIDDFARLNSLNLTKNDHNADYTTTRVARKKVILAKPQTFMNKSGLAVRKIADYYDIKPADILVIHDDLDLELGRVKIKSGGGHGGHNGIKSIINHLSSKDFARVKMGIGRPESGQVTDHVLGKFSKEELKNIADSIDVANDTIDLFVTNNLEQAMNKHN